jgi:RHS repeat-associated protein
MPTLRAVRPDRLGSVRRGGAYAWRRATYYPFGEKHPESNSHWNLDVSNQTAFRTYQRDANGSGGTFDYAMNRYYAPQWGRFTTPDPYQASAQFANPQSWNRYSYVENDPVNFNDPSGLDPRAEKFCADQSKVAELMCTPIVGASGLAELRETADSIDWAISMG